MKSKLDIFKYKLVLLMINSFRKVKIRDDKSNNGFFILGSGRNGSTLLASILNAHNELIIPPEQFVLPYAIMKRYFYVFQSTTAWQKNVNKMFLDKRKTLNWEIDLEGINVENKDVSELFNKIFFKYAELKTKKIKLWGDKTPINIHFIKFIYPEFSNSKYIFLIRDVRDVVLSYKKLDGHKAQNINYAIWKWKDSIEKLCYLQNNTDVLIVKYEKLVGNTKVALKKVLHFLEISYSENIIQQKLKAFEMGLGTKKHHENLDKPISSKSVGGWKGKLNQQEISLIESKCGKELLQFDYKI